MTVREHTCTHCNFVFKSAFEAAKPWLCCPNCRQPVPDALDDPGLSDPESVGPTTEDMIANNDGREEINATSDNDTDGFQNRMFSMAVEKGGLGKSVKDAWAEFKTFDYGLLRPMLMVFVPRLLRQKAVKWVAGFGLFPLFVLYLSRLFSLPFEKTAWFLGAYFCIFWIVFFNSTFAPSAQIKKQGIKWAFFTMLIGLPILFAWQGLPVIRDIYSGTRSQAFVLRLLAFILGVGVCEELCKALPLLLFGRNKPAILKPRNAIYLGIMSGLGFALAEVVQYTYSYWQDSAAVSAELVSYALGNSITWRGDINIDAFSNNLRQALPILVEYYGNTVTAQIVRFMTLPLLHGAWAGVVGYFIGLSLLKKKAQWIFITIGIATMAVLHGLYDVFAGGLLGLGVAAASILILMSYLSEEEKITSRVEDSVPTSHDV